MTIAEDVFAKLAAEACLKYQHTEDPKQLTIELSRALTSANIAQMFYDRNSIEEAARVTSIANAFFQRKETAQ